jgi:5-methylcytosine-specific restriction enzyme A
MARRSLAVCAEPGCPELSTRSYCEEHERQRERQRGTRTQRGLGDDWIRLRDRIVRQHVAAHGWTCPGHGRPPHPVEPGKLTGDHIVPRSVAPDRRLDPANVQVLCLSCNSRKGAR